MQSLERTDPVSRTKTTLFLLISTILTVPAIAQNLTLDDYLSQVEGQNQNLVSAKETAQGAQLSVAEGSLIYSPTLFAEASWTDDKFRNALFPSAYTSFTNNTYTVGIRQQTGFGLAGAVSYDLNKLGYLGAITPPATTPADRVFWEGTPKVELTFQLWRNFFGSETQAEKTVIESGARAAQYNASAQAKQARADAETTYVQLASYQELIRVYQDSVETAQDLLRFNTRQVGMHLADNSDLYQAQANLELQRLNLQTTRDSYRQAASDFNRLRNVDSDEVKEKLTMPAIDALKPPARADASDLIRASQENARLVSAQATLGYERNRPRFEAFGSFALNSRDATFGDTFSGSFGLGQQTTMFGLRLNVPLAVGLSSDARKGFELRRDAADRLVTQRTFEEEVQWKNLIKQLDEAKKRYEIATTLSKLQRKKVEAENLRLKRGRTTTYQTVVFNQEFNAAEASRVQALTNVLSIYARMKTFGGSAQ
jgi:outer membrane protein TolC